jgi:hypothetical protein
MRREGGSRTQITAVGLPRLAITTSAVDQFSGGRTLAVGEVAERPGQVGQEGIGPGSGQRAADGDGLLDDGEGVLLPAHVAEVDGEVVERPGEVGQEGVGAGGGRWYWLEPQAEGMTGRVAQDSPAFRRGLLSFFDGSESDRLCLGVVEVVGVVDGEVEMDLL